LRAGRYAEARDCLQEATAGATANGVGNLLLGEACLHLGDYWGAWHATARAAELAPKPAQVPKDRQLAFLVKAMWRLARLRSRLEPRRLRKIVFRGHS
jgi:hypothetical protein